MSLRCFFAVARRPPEGRRATRDPAPPRWAASRQRRQFSGLLMLSDCSNQAPSCRAVGKAPDPDQKQRRVNKTLDCRAPLMNACIHNLGGRENQWECLIWRWNATGPDCLTVEDGCSRRCRTGGRADLSAAAFSLHLRKQKSNRKRKLV